MTTRRQAQAKWPRPRGSQATAIGPPVADCEVLTVKLLEVEDEAYAASTLIDLRDKVARGGLCRRNHSVVEDDL